MLDMRNLEIWVKISWASKSKSMTHVTALDLSGVVPVFNLPKEATLNQSIRDGETAGRRGRERNFAVVFASPSLRLEHSESGKMEACVWAKKLRGALGCCMAPWFSIDGATMVDDGSRQI